jgi:phosphodiesterase/alkaline phosphatase D-like protein
VCKLRLSRLHLTALSVMAAGALCASVPALADAAPEAPVTGAATGVTGTAALLHGTLNPGSTAVAGWYFAYSTSGQCTAGSTTPVEPEVEVKALKVQAPATGLEPSRKYTACLVAVHTAEEVTETTVGTQVTFTTTRSAPTIDAVALVSTAATSAVVESAINPEREDASCKVEYGKTLAYGSVAPCPSDLGGGFGDVAASIELTGLEPATTYHYRVVAENVTGVTKAGSAELTTASVGKPEIESESVTGITSTEATFGAVLNARYEETTYHVEYATDETLTEPVTIPGVGEALRGNQPESVPPVTTANALAADTTYYYRVVAENASGVTDGPIGEFTTVGLPEAETGEAGGIGATSAALSGTIDPEGATTSYRFLYVDQAQYHEGAANPYVDGTSTEANSLAASRATTPIGPTAVEGLSPGTIYHYALAATNEAGTTVGADATFVTAAALPPGASSGDESESSQPTPFVRVPVPGFPSLSGVKPVPGPVKSEGSVEPPSHLSNKQKLAKALKACKKSRQKVRRASCERAARHRYPVKKGT